MKALKINTASLCVEPGKKISLTDYDSGLSEPFTDKKMALQQLESHVQQIAKLQNILYAQNSYAVLIILQGMDTAGKDSVIRYVMSGINPQGVEVHSFKEPSVEELDHDFLWRSMKALPARGTIGVFNRSYYEEVLVTRVHPEILKNQKIPLKFKDKEIWDHRYEDINNFEKYLVRNGVVVLKFFLHLSKHEQKQRLLARLNEFKKNWKFSVGDVDQRAYWSKYTQAYEQALSHTSTEHAPWYIIPADHKWFSRVAIADIIVEKMKSLNLKFPGLDEKQRQELTEGKVRLEAETD